MGNDVSYGPIQPISTNADVFAIVPLNACGKLIVIGVPSECPVIQSICNAITAVIGHSPGIKPVEPYVTTIKCRTNFLFRIFKPALKLKLIWTGIFYNLHSIGYRPLISTDMQQYEKTENFQFFERTRQPLPSALAMVSLSSYNKFQVITEPMYHAEIMNSMGDIMQHQWSGMKALKYRRPHNISSHWEVTEIDLGCVSVWTQFFTFTNVFAENLTRGRYLLGWVATHLGKEQGWKLYTAANIKGYRDFMWFYKEGSNGEVPIEDLPPPPQYFEHSHGFAGYGGSFLADTRPATISLCSHDKLRMSGVPPHLIDAIRDSLNASGLAIQKEDPEKYHHIGGGFEFKLCGTPWHCSKDQAIRVRVAFMKIFEAALRNQYRVLASLNTSTKIKTRLDKSSFILVPCQTFTDYSRVRSLVVSTTSKNHMRIIGSYTDAELQGVLQVACQYPGGIKKEQWQANIDNTEMAAFNGAWRCYFIEFGNKPWSSWRGSSSTHFIEKHSSLGGHTAMMLINIMSVLRHQGWELVCAADVSGDYVRRESHSSRIDTDEWFFVKID